MPSSLPVFGVLFLLLLSACELPPIGNRTDNEASEVRFEPISLDYPQPYRDTSIRDTFGRKIVADPYRWMESGTDPGLKTWIRDQRMLSDTYFLQLPFRAAIEKRLSEFGAYEQWGIPEKHGDYYFLHYQDGISNKDGLYRMTSIKDSLELVVAPNVLKLSPTDHFTSFSFSNNGKLLALEYTEPFSSPSYLLIWNCETRQLLPEQLKGVQYSKIAWYKNGFFYSRYLGQNGAIGNQERPVFHQLFYHEVGTSQDQDVLVYADRRRPLRRVQAQVDATERWLVLSVQELGRGNALYFRDLRSDDPSFIPIVESLENEFHFVASDGEALLIRTDRQAPQGRLIRLSTQWPEPAYWEDIIPEEADVLQDVYVSGKHFIAHYLHNGSSELRLLDEEAQVVRRLSLPGIGTVAGIRLGNRPNELFYSFSSFTQPETVYRLQLDDYATSIFRKPPLPFYAAAYETKQVWYESYDGTQVPLFLVHKKNLELTGDHATLLLGHPGMGHTMSPSWNPTGLHLLSAFLENGGVCAMAAIRGGGERGTSWEQAGRLGQQQQRFDDFQAAAEYLMTNRYTKREKLAIYGEGNGALVVGACLTQRPDLFQVVVMKDAFLDMLRYTHFTGGWVMESEFGTVADSLHKDALLSYSPLHNLEPLAYPASLLVVSQAGRQAAPEHTFKFTAELQSLNTGNSPVLMRMWDETKSIASEKRKEGADVLSFLLYNLQESWAED